MLSAVRQYALLDYLATVAGFLAISTPSFFLGLGLVYLFAVRWQLLPSSGMRTLGGDESAPTCCGTCAAGGGAGRWPRRRW